MLVCGTTSSDDGWLSGGWIPWYGGGLADGFVVKLSSSGQFVWSSYLGGSDSEGATGVAVDGSGNVIVTGRTSSADWVSGGFDTSYNGGPNIGDGFVLKLSPTGEHLWSSYLGGQDDDGAAAVDVDSAGNIYGSSDRTANTSGRLISAAREVTYPLASRWIAKGQSSSWGRRSPQDGFEAGTM